jgi:hypothetical protein
MSGSDLYTAWFWETPDLHPEETYVCDGPGVVQMVNSTTEFSCTLWENVDGTGKKHVIPRQTEIDELSFSPKSLTFAPDSPQDHPKLSAGERMFNFFRELSVEPPVPARTRSRCTSSTGPSSWTGYGTGPPTCGAQQHRPLHHT